MNDSSHPINYNKAGKYWIIRNEEVNIATISPTDLNITTTTTTTTTDNNDDNSNNSNNNNNNNNNTITTTLTATYTYITTILLSLVLSSLPKTTSSNK